MLSVGLTLALMAALVSCQLKAWNEDFAAVSPAGFWRNTFFTHQLSHFPQSWITGEKLALLSLDKVSLLLKL